MSESLCMLTLPSSGSTWLAQLIAANSRWNRFYMEFFNPARNLENYDTLAPFFGCELIDCYRNIATGDTPGIDAVIASTWQQGGCNFTKEVWSPYKLQVFARHFRCFVLLRDARDTFPPGRRTVWVFYEHAWHALRAAGVRVGSGSYEERSVIAHKVMHAHLQREARRLGVPVVNYRDLFRGVGLLKDKLDAAIGESGRQLVEAIRESRYTAADRRRGSPLG